jgi:hypothetical protein
MGAEKAAIMMDLLPPVGWGDIATGADLEALRAEMRGGFAELRGEIAEFRGEMAQLRGEMTGLRGEMKLGNGELLHRFYFGLVASQATMAGLIFAAIKLA